MLTRPGAAWSCLNVYVVVVTVLQLLLPQRGSFPENYTIFSRDPVVQCTFDALHSRPRHFVIAN